MALKVKANERLQKIGTYAGTYRYIMAPELYTSLSQATWRRTATWTAATAMMVAAEICHQPEDID